LFSVVIADVRLADLRPLGPSLVEKLHAELHAEQLPLETFGALDPRALQVAKTASGSVLGYMNDMKQQIDYAVDTNGGLKHCDIDSINRHLRRTPYHRGAYVYPIDLAARRAGAKRLEAPPSPRPHADQHDPTAGTPSERTTLMLSDKTTSARTDARTGSLHTPACHSTSRR